MHMTGYHRWSFLIHTQDFSEAFRFGGGWMAFIPSNVFCTLRGWFGPLCETICTKPQLSIRNVECTPDSTDCQVSQDSKEGSRPAFLQSLGTCAGACMCRSQPPPYQVLSSSLLKAAVKTSSSRAEPAGRSGAIHFLTARDRLHRDCAATAPRRTWWSDWM